MVTEMLFFRDGLFAGLRDCLIMVFLEVSQFASALSGGGKENL
jgi:hypothetical protein